MFCFKNVINVHLAQRPPGLVGVSSSYPGSSSVPLGQIALNQALTITWSMDNKMTRKTLFTEINSLASLANFLDKKISLKTSYTSISIFSTWVEKNYHSLVYPIVLTSYSNSITNLYQCSFKTILYL